MFFVEEKGREIWLICFSLDNERTKCFQTYNTCFLHPSNEKAISKTQRKIEKITKSKVKKKFFKKMLVM